MARDILCQFDTHKPLLDAKVKFDLLFAMGDKDEDGHVVTDAITHGGEKALGLTRILNLKDRAKGNGPLNFPNSGLRSSRCRIRCRVLCR